MPETDLEALRARYRELSDESVAELHAAGPGAYLPHAWAILEAEFHGRGHPASPACRDPLPGEPPVEPGASILPPGPDLICVFTGSDLAQVLVAKLLLQAQGIPFVAEGDMVQDFIGVGRILGGFNLVTGPVQLRVAHDDLDLALEVLRDLRTASDIEPSSHPEDSPDEPLKGGP